MRLYNVFIIFILSFYTDNNQMIEHHNFFTINFYLTKINGSEMYLEILRIELNFCAIFWHIVHWPRCLHCFIASFRDFKKQNKNKTNGYYCLQNLLHSKFAAYLIPQHIIAASLLQSNTPICHSETYHQYLKFDSMWK